MVDGLTAWRAVYRSCIRSAAMIALISAIGCSTGPTNPTGTPTNSLAGTWSGTTFQGRSIVFTISQSHQLTALSVGYEIDTCSGVASFPNVAIPMFSVSGTGAMAFAYGETLPDRPEVGVSVQGYSMPDNAITGPVIVYGRRSCGTSESVAGMFRATHR
jgi:hypothetical protein